MATLDFHRLIIEKLKVAFIAISDILTKVFLFFFKCLLSGPLPNIYFLFKPLNLIGCHGNQKAQFEKNIKKSTPHKLYGGWSWNFAEMFIALAPKRYWGKWKLALIAVLVYCGYLNRTFLDSFVE